MTDKTTRDDEGGGLGLPLLLGLGAAVALFGAGYTLARLRTISGLGGAAPCAGCAEKAERARQAEAAEAEAYADMTAAEGLAAQVPADQAPAAANGSVSTGADSASVG